MSTELQFIEVGRHAPRAQAHLWGKVAQAAGVCAGADGLDGQKEGDTGRGAEIKRSRGSPVFAGAGGEPSGVLVGAGRRAV